MKKYSNALIVIMFCLLFINSRTLLGQSQVTRYTPVGSSVRAYNQIPEMTSGDKADWSNYVSINYPQATELNPNSATRSYNCHAYAWHVTQGGDKVWIGYYQSQQGDEDIYWTDGSYIRLNSESGADKISYYQDNHSAIQTSTQGIYKSKWGEGPLMQHSRDYGPVDYYMAYRYYYDSPIVTGDDKVCYPGSKTFSIQDFYNVTYVWTTSSNLQINGPNTGRTISVSPTSSASGIGLVSLSITILDYNKTIIVTKSVWIGKPSFTSSVNGPSQLTPGLSAVYSITPAAGASSYSWQIPSGCYYNYCWHITSGQGTTAISVQAGAIGSGAVQVTASNACPGNDSRYMYVNVQDPQAPCDPLTLSISPNPSVGGDVVIDVIKPPCDPTLMSATEATVSITDNMGNIVYSKKHTGNKVAISGLNLIQGVYHVVYIQNNKRFEKSMIVQ